MKDTSGHYQFLVQKHTDYSKDINKLISEINSYKPAFDQARYTFTSQNIQQLDGYKSYYRIGKDGKDIASLAIPSWDITRSSLDQDIYVTYKADAKTITPIKPSDPVVPSAPQTSQASQIVQTSNPAPVLPQDKPDEPNTNVKQNTVPAPVHGEDSKKAAVKKPVKRSSTKAAAPTKTKTGNKQKTNKEAVKALAKPIKQQRAAKQNKAVDNAPSKNSLPQTGSKDNANLALLGLGLLGLSAVAIKRQKELL